MKPKSERFILKAKVPEGVRMSDTKKILDDQTEGLISEMERLEKGLEEYKSNYRIYEAFAFPEFIDDEKFDKFVDKWKDKVRKKTNLLAPLDQLGIRVFCDDLENQPAFPGTVIEFGSRDVHEENVKNAKNAGGWTYSLTKKIQIQSRKLSLRAQMHHFMYEGTLDSATSTVVHESIHRAHFTMNSQTPLLLSEVQAHFSSIFARGDVFSVSQIIDALTNEKVGYQFNKGDVVRNVRAVVLLLGSGEKYSTISNLIATSKQNQVSHKYLPLEKEAEKILKTFDLDSLDQQALDYIYQMYVTNQRLKAQLLLFETLDEEFKLDDLKKAKEAVLQGRIVRSQYEYDDEGQLDESHAGKLLQASICPMDKEFPYDIMGRRTGVTFGFVMRDNKMIFRIGRFDATDNSETVKWTDDANDIGRLFDVIKQKSSKISFNGKLDLFARYAGSNQINEESMKLLRALASDDELKKMVAECIQFYDSTFTWVLEELQSMGHYGAEYVAGEVKKKLQAYKQRVELYESLVKGLGKDIAEDLTKAVQPKVDQIKESLATYG
ncbi:MAG: hypothetical protein HY225_03705 [Candidatus Vogelbacteria bacterium]|nr:hypothetical protein [Candidatus Vogelbacteria bacterium]